MYVGDIPRRNAFRYPDAVGWESAEGAWTWAEANARVNRLAHALAARGLAKGDRVGVLSYPSHRVAETYFAAAKLGLVIVPVHTGLVSREVAFILRDVAARALFVEDACREVAGPALAELGARPLVVGMGAEHGCPADYEALLVEGDAREPAAAVDENDLFAIRFTSGTTGQPKGCPSTHRQWLQRSVNFLAHVHHDQRDRALLFAPLSLGVGSSMLVSYSYLGCRQRFLRRFDADQILDSIARERITTFMMPVPSLFAKLLERQGERPRDLSSLRLVGYGGAVFPLPLLRETLAAFPCDFFGVYGHLEAGGFSTYLLPEDHRLGDAVGEKRARRERRLTSCGREALQADVRIVDEAGQEVPRGEVGELVVRTEGMIADYWHRPGEIEKVLRDGWFHTGDGAWLDEDGYVYIADRIKDTVRTGGMNVYSIEVENTLREHPAVADAAIVGVPDPVWGEAVTAFVVRRAGQGADAATLIEHCKGRLAGYKVPKHVEFLDALPQNSMNKVLKTELRQRFVAQQKDR
ncbi:MAG TPA: AMP-binding protein [Chloroflexota bacterium]